MGTGEWKTRVGELKRRVIEGNTSVTWFGWHYRTETRVAPTSAERADAATLFAAHVITSAIRAVCRVNALTS